MEHVLVLSQYSVARGNAALQYATYFIDVFLSFFVVHIQTHMYAFLEGWIQKQDPKDALISRAW